MEKTRYDLAPSQGLMYLAMKWAIHKQVINVPTSFTLQEELDFDILKRALEIEIQRNDVLRLRFVKEGGKVKQYFEDNPPTPQFELLDFTGKTEEEQVSYLDKISSKPFKIYKEYPFNIFMLKEFDGYCGMYMNVNHLIMDSHATMVFYKDVLDIYYALKNNTDMPKPLTPYEEILKQELAYIGTEAEARDRKFFEDLFTNNSEPIFTGADGRAALIKQRKKKPNARAASNFALFNTKGAKEAYHVTREKSEEMFEFCKETGIPFQCLLYMGIRTFLSVLNENESDISFIGTVARRATLAEKRSGGTRIHCYPFRNIATEDRTVMSVLEEMKEYQNSCFRHVNLDYQIMLELNKKIFNIGPDVSYEGISVTFQPAVMNLPTDCDMRSRWYDIGYSSHALYLTVMHDISKAGGMNFHYEHMTSKLNADDTLRIHNIILDTIECTMQNPQITVGELLAKYN